MRVRPEPWKVPTCKNTSSLKTTAEAQKPLQLWSKWSDCIVGWQKNLVVPHRWFHINEREKSERSSRFVPRCLKGTEARQCVPGFTSLQRGPARLLHKQSRRSLTCRADPRLLELGWFYHSPKLSHWQHRICCWLPLFYNGNVDPVLPCAGGTYILLSFTGAQSEELVLSLRRDFGLWDSFGLLTDYRSF